MTPVERLEALLSRIQRNAAALARARVSGLQDSEASPAIDGDGSHQTPSAAAPSAASREPSAPEPSATRVSVPAPTEPGVAAGDLEAQLDTPAASAARQEPAPSARSEDLEPSAPRTPPPESGPQVAPPARLVPLMDETAPISAGGDGAAMEQLGATVELEPATTSPIEMLREPERAPPTVEDYEEPLAPAHSAVYDETLAAPEGAADELAAIDERERERAARLSVIPEVALAEPSDTIAVPPPSAAPPPSERPAAGPGIVTRSQVPAHVVPTTYEGARRAAARTFLALLDESLGLSAD